MSFVCADLGASGTRYCSERGVVSILPNNMVTLGEGYNKEKVSSLMPSDDKLENCLELTITRKDNDDKSGLYPATVLIGSMATRHPSDEERPSVMSNKCSQRINYISAITAVALSKIKDKTSTDVDLYIAVPPVEINIARQVLPEQLCGEYSVYLPKYLSTGATVNVNIKSVTVYEESYMSTVSFMFGTDGKPKAENSKYLAGNMLSIDIGASTSDLAVVKNGVYQEKSGQTYKTGGNIARDYVIDRVREKYGYDLPIEDAEKVMAEGRLQLGASFEDASEIVNAGKDQLALSIVNSMQSYFRKINMPIQLMNCILVSGGGSMQSQYVDDNGNVIKTSDPISEFVTRRLRTVCSTVPVVPYGDEARFANVRGLFIRALFDLLTSKAAQA